MIQAKIVSKGNVIVENVEVPKPKENEVLFKIKYAAICGSDRIMMKDPSFFSYPVVNGHELVGTVETDGKKVKKGLRAAVMPFVCCRKCGFCRSGAYNLCESLLFIGGTPVNGGFAEYITAEEDMLYPIPASISDEAASLVEPTSVAYHGISLANPARIKSAMVIGAGIIGLLSVKILKNRYKIDNIAALDVSDKKLETAARNGARTVVNLKNTDWKTVKSLNSNPFVSGPYDAVIDYASTTQSVEIALANLKKGGTLVVTGLPHDDVTIGKLTFFAVAAKELSIKGCYCYVPQDFVDVIDMLAKGTISVDELVSAKYDLKDVARAFADWETHYAEWYKVLLKP